MKNKSSSVLIITKPVLGPLMKAGDGGASGWGVGAERNGKFAKDFV